MSQDADPSILIVDDDADLAGMYAAWLGPDYEVDIAHDPFEAIDLLDETIDVVLLDRHYPDGSGDDVLNFIRESGLDCRVAMVTAVEPGFEILEMGFDDYVCKPIREDELRNTTQRLLDQAEYRDIFEEYYILVRKKALLEERFSLSTLRNHTGYEDLKERCNNLDATLGDLVTGFTDEQMYSELLEH